MDPSYFTCTLGQAALDQTKLGHWQNVVDLIDQQSDKYPDSPAVGFAYPPGSDRDDDNATVLYTFKDVCRATILAANLLSGALHGASPRASSTVALLSSSTPEFLCTWLALLRLGYAVLLVAPQNQPEAIIHLCNVCEVEFLIHDDLYHSLAESAHHHAKHIGHKALSLIKIPFNTSSDTFKHALSSENSIYVHVTSRSADDVAYFFHTSGTSSGLPKPIPQTHHAAVGVLPRIAGGSQKATYSTTPLYHGGISDLLRAWSSGALIWLFPGKGSGSEGRPIPISASNILSSFNAIDRNHADAPAVRYFTSVPYILQMMASASEGLKRLQSMDCAGVGGAALPEEVGNRLVDLDVNLVSRYGSAECGFLLSSHRDYKIDKAWQYLRADTGVEHVAFESQADGRYEVVVKPGWPHMAKTNREDGSYATADLMTRHPSIPNAWRYDSRTDSQLTLVTGKKFDPAPLEKAIASDPLLEDVLIFGNGQAFPGALLFRSKDAQYQTDENLISAIEPRVEELNSKSQSHARIPRNMLVPIEYGKNELAKSSKGTILRNKAEETYREHIASAYGRLNAASNDYVPDDKVYEAIQEAVGAVVGTEVVLDEDLFAHGLDSVGSIRVRHTLQHLLAKGQEALPMSVVEDFGTILKLTEVVLRHRHGEQPSVDKDSDLQYMQDLVHKYGEFPPQAAANLTGHDQDADKPEQQIVLLTGATGALGAHLLHQYRSCRTTRKVYCLVRGTDEHAATERVKKSLISRRLPDLSPSDSQAEVIILPCKLSNPSLGLTQDQYSTLIWETTHIIHAAWSVNFRWRLHSFERDHIAGTRHLLDLALASPKLQKPGFIFCSSIASVSATSPSPNSPSHASVTIPERPSTNPLDATPLGYSRSKWVTEAILTHARKVRPDLNVQIFRIGQLSGDTTHGIWNATEAWPLMLSSMAATRSLPNLREYHLDWLPVDVAAEAIIQSADGQVGQDGEKGEVPVRHIVNPDHDAKWSSLLQWLKSFGEEFEVLGPAEWVTRLQELEEQRKDHPALRLLGMWKERYGAGAQDRTDESQKGEEASDEREVRFSVEQAKAAAPVLKTVGPVDEEYFRKLWRWIKENVGNSD